MHLLVPVAERYSTSLVLSQSVVLSGNSATFTCSSNGRNVSLIFTSPDNKLITAATAGIKVNVRVGGVRIYTITSVKPSQAGRYVCSVVGGNPSSIVLHVQSKIHVYLSYHNVSCDNIVHMKHFNVRILYPILKK